MSENVECVWAEINKDQRLTVWELQAYLGIPKTTAWDFNAVSWHEICHGKMLPQLLLQEQKEHHAAVANGLIQTATNEPDFLKKVITRDESWGYGCELEMKTQSSQWTLLGSPCPKKEQQSRRKIKIVLTVFLDWEGVIQSWVCPSRPTN